MFLVYWKALGKRLSEALSGGFQSPLGCDKNRKLLLKLAEEDDHKRMHKSALTEGKVDTKSSS